MRTELMGASLETVGKTSAIALALEKIAGGLPLTQYTDTQGIISFTPEQAENIRNYIRSKSKATGQPPDVKINFLPVVLPLVLETAVPIVGGLLLAGYILGVRKRRKRRK
jgi:hypothetical protein